MDKDTSTSIACLLVLSLTAVLVLASLATGFLFGAGYGFAVAAGIALLHTVVVYFAGAAAIKKERKSQEGKTN